MSTQSLERLERYIDDQYELCENRHPNGLGVSGSSAEQSHLTVTPVTSVVHQVHPAAPENDKKRKRCGTGDDKSPIIEFGYDSDLYANAFDNSFEFQEQEQEQVQHDKRKQQTHQQRQQQQLDPHLDPDLPNLPQIRSEQDKAEILSILSAWLGEMNCQMQEQFNVRFEEAIDDVTTKVKSALMHEHSAMEGGSVTSVSSHIDDVMDENRVLKNRCELLEGRLTRAEMALEELKENQLEQQARSMENNVKFFNIPESNDENENCMSTIRNFLRDEMKVPHHDLQKIQLEKASRSGKKRRNKTRVMIATVNTQGKHIIFKYVKNLDKSKKFGISDQLPRELDERKKRLMPQFKEAKRGNKNVKWTRDRLVIDGKLSAVQKDDIKNLNMNATQKAVTLQEEVRRSELQEHEGHTFQGHSVTLQNKDYIVPALHAIYANERVARAKHNIYAYRVKTGSGMLEHYNDDGEWGAGAKLLELLQEKGVENTLVCTSRWYGSSHLGRARFQQIINAAKKSLPA